MTDLAAIYRLREEDVPGASLSGKSAEDLNMEQLKWWLACRGARRSGRKAELVQRLVHVAGMASQHRAVTMCVNSLICSSLQGEGVRSHGFVRFNSKGSCTDKASPAPYIEHPSRPLPRMMSLLLYLEYAIHVYEFTMVAGSIHSKKQIVVL